MNITMLVPEAIVASVRKFAPMVEKQCAGMFLSPVSVKGSQVVAYRISSGDAGLLFAQAVRNPAALDIAKLKAKLSADVQADEDVIAMTNARLQTAISKCLIHYGTTTITHEGISYTVPQSPQHWLDSLGLELTQMPDTTGAKK